MPHKGAPDPERSGREAEQFSASQGKDETREWERRGVDGWGRQERQMSVVISKETPD